jgi:hypothetical protein
VKTRRRNFHLVAINERTKKRTMLNSSPLTLDEAYIMRAKFKVAKGVRIVVEEWI